MTSPPTRVISSLDEGRQVFDYFNGFHDGFMKRMEIVSQDEIDEDHGQQCTGVYDVVVDFAHYNYADGDSPFHPYNQIVRARFRDVHDIFCDLQPGYLGNTISALSVTPKMRITTLGGTPEECLGLQLARNFYIEQHRRFELRQSELFTFKDAVFEELNP
jgi:hypothetical protein